MKVNKPTIDKLFDAGMHNQYGLRIDFNHNADRNRTQVFVLSDEVALAAEKLIRSNTFGPPDLSKFRLPYRHMAVEYAITPDIRTLRGPGIPGTYTINRVGVHIGTQVLDDGREVLCCHPYWEFASGAIHTSLFTFCIGEIDKRLPVLEFGKQAFHTIKSNVLPSFALMDVLERAKLPPEQVAKSFEDPAMKIHIQEAGGEIPTLLFACGALLTCKSGVAQARVPAKVARESWFGERKRKAMSHSPYTVVHLSALETVDRDGTVASKVDMAAHYVRGHFKQRHTGVYWWSPFIRGNGELRKRDAYIVKE